VQYRGDEPGGAPTPSVGPDAVGGKESVNVAAEADMAYKEAYNCA
jgi:hypothetical protein